jgi:quercetin dioxygenase-like cupin family protein
LRTQRSPKWVAAIFVVGLVGTIASVALANHLPFQFAGEPPLVTANFDEVVHVNSDRVKLQTKGPTDVRVQKLNVGPGGFSGWHHHPGLVIVTVASGTLTYTTSDCQSKTYGPGLPNGAVFVESGDKPAQASSTTGATLYATYIAPSADPFVFRIDDHEAPGCP